MIMSLSAPRAPHTRPTRGYTENRINTVCAPRAPRAPQKHTYIRVSARPHTREDSCFVEESAKGLNMWGMWGMWGIGPNHATSRPLACGAHVGHMWGTRKEVITVMPIPVDPRPDLRADSMLWERLMSAASPELAGASHGLRCLGTRLIRTAKGYAVRPDPEALASVGWTYTEIRDTYLAPHTSELVRLMANLGRAAS